jgi:hypothetical protein
MSSNDLKDTIELVSRAKALGVIISYRDEQLELKDYLRYANHKFVLSLGHYSL